MTAPSRSGVPFRTLIAVVLSPILGALADQFGVGTALATVGGAMLLLSQFVRVKDA